MTESEYLRSMRTTTAREVELIEQARDIRNGVMTERGANHDVYADASRH